MKNYVIITGASSGIGKSTAQFFLNNQWHVINLSRSPCDIKGVINYFVDLLDHNWVQSIPEELIQHLSHATKISIVHNAGVAWRDTIKALPAMQFREVLEINVIAPSILNQLIFPYMKHGSSIIYIGSTLSEKAVPNNASYVTSKHAIAGLMKATTQDLENSGIHTCCICPGLTDTPMLRARVDYDENTLESLRQISTTKRLVEPEEIAEFIWFCANHAVINGAVLHANLGQVEK